MAFKKPKLVKPKIGGDVNIWGDKLNLNVDEQDAFNNRVSEYSDSVDSELIKLNKDKLDKGDFDDEVWELTKGKVDDYIHTDVEPKLDLYIETDSKEKIEVFVEGGYSDLTNKTNEKLRQLDSYTTTKENSLEFYTSGVIYPKLDKHADSLVQGMSDIVEGFVEEAVDELLELIEEDVDALVEVKKGEFSDFAEGCKDLLREELPVIQSEITVIADKAYGDMNVHAYKKEAQLDVYTESKFEVLSERTDREIDRIHSEGVEGKQNKVDGSLDTPSKVLVEAVNQIYRDLDEKVDDAYVDESNNLVLTASGVEVVSIQLPEGGGGGGGGGGNIQRNVRILNNLPSKNITAMIGKECFVEFTFISQERYTSSEEFEDTGERGDLEISIKNTNNSSYTVVHRRTINSSEKIKLNISEFLDNGHNQVMLKVAGEVSSVTTPAFVYTVSVTSLAVYADTFSWWTIYDTPTIFVPLRIGGNLNKSLCVNISNKEGYSEDILYDIGYSIYLDTTYNIRVPKPKDSGIYTLAIHVESKDGLIKTEPKMFDIICLGEDKSGKYVVINNVVKTIENWASSKLGEYCCYDGGKVTTELNTILYKGDEQVFYMEEKGVLTSSKCEARANLEVDTKDNADFKVDLILKTGDKAETDKKEIYVSNVNSFSPEAGSVFYMNPKNRSNSQHNREKVVNETDSSEVSAIWNNFNWSNDGWVTDLDGDKTLRVLAGSTVEINYNPLLTESSRKGLTIELDVCTRNARAYESPIMCISNREEGQGLVGIQLTPDKITMCSQAKKNIEAQSKYFEDDVRHRFTYVISPDSYGYPGFNTCILYINGVKNRVFTYESNDYFSQPLNILIGSKEAGIDIYGIRTYDKALSADAVLKNFVSLLSSTAERNKVLAKNDIFDPLGQYVDYHTVKKQYNTIVFDNVVPSYTDASRQDGTLIIEYPNNPEWNSTTTLVNARGQGTTAMFYWIWNTRFHVSKESEITYGDGRTAVGRVLEWYPGAPGGERFTAKKNFASPMHSHKMGSVGVYHDVYRAMGFKNEAMKSEVYANARVAVEQLPFFQFQKIYIEGEEEPVYEFRGLMTFGSDKGDKDTFGFDNKVFPNVLGVEGSDNAPLLALFRVPWDTEKVMLDEEGKYVTYNGVNSWEVNVGKAVQLEGFIDAYDIAYTNSPKIRAYPGTLEDMQQNIDDIKFEPYEYWVGVGPKKYELYYYESSEGVMRKSSQRGVPINVYTQLVDKGYGLTDADLVGLSLEHQNDLFIQARVNRFRKEAPTQWNIEESLYFMNTIEFNAGTDERAKNTYPYRHSTNTPFSWRADDMDTRFDITNRGLANKPYWVEFYDLDEHGTPYWNGLASNFWLLLDMAFPTEKVSNMVKMIDAMIKVSGVGLGDEYYKLCKLYDKYFWSKAQEHFPQAGYNVDMKYMHEDAKIAYMQGVYSNDTDPMEQALGDHYTSSLRWVHRRIVYMMSKYSYGMFSADGLDTIVVRASGNVITYDITPAIDMYPAVSNGITIIRGNRTKANETCRFRVDLAGSGDQQNAIQGVQYIRDIGEWHTKNVNGSMLVRGRRLEVLNLGHKTERVIINISSLTVSGCVSMRDINLSNIQTLTGTLDLRGCQQLTRLWAEGTKLTQIRLPEGGQLALAEFGDHVQYLTLKSQNVLDRNGLKINKCMPKLSDVFIQDCTNIDPIKLIGEIIATQESLQSEGMGIPLKRIRLAGFTNTFEDSKGLEGFLALGDGRFGGLDSDGLATSGLPEIIGKVHINSFVYSDDLIKLNSLFPSLEITALGFAKKFDDPEVEKELVRVIDKNKDGYISEEEVDTSVTLGIYQMNKKIKSFNEVKDFKRVRSIEAINFNSSTLEEITLHPNLVVLKDSSFAGCENLRSVLGIEHVTSMEQDVFYGCEMVNFEQLNPSITKIPTRAFKGCTSLDLNLDGSDIQEVMPESFCNTMVRMSRLPNILGASSFEGCKNIEADVLVSSYRGEVLPYKVLNNSSCSNRGFMSISEDIRTLEELSLGVIGLKNVEFLGSNITIHPNTFSSEEIITIRVPWSEGAKPNAPWGAINATIYYDCKPTEDLFEDPSICEYVKMLENPFTTHNQNSFDRFELFGSETLPNPYTNSWFSGRDITSLKGMELFKNLKGFTINNSNCTAKKLELASDKLVSLCGALKNCQVLDEVILPIYLPHLVDLEDFSLGCEIKRLYLPAIIPKLSTILQVTYLDRANSIITFYHSEGLSYMSQLIYHDPSGKTLFTKSTMDYSLLEVFYEGIPINKLFRCPTISEYIGLKLGKGITEGVTSVDLNSIEHFGSDYKVSNLSMNSYFNNRDILSFKGCEYLGGLRSIYLKSCRYIGDEYNITFSKLPHITHMYGAFYNMKGSKKIVLDFNTSEVLDMTSMFQDTESSEIDCTKLATQKVTTMKSMFQNSNSLKLDLYNFNTENVTNMSSMFYNSKAQELHINTFNTNKVTDMWNMFNNSSVDSLDISSFNSALLIDAYDMFKGCFATKIKLQTGFPNYASISLSSLGLDKTGRVIQYAENPNILFKYQIRFHHNSTGIPEYTLSKMDYTLLVNCALPIIDKFEDRTIADFIAYILNKDVNTEASKAEFASIQHLGSNNFATTSSVESFFKGKTITSFVGCKALTGLRSIYFKGAELEAPPGVEELSVDLGSNSIIYAREAFSNVSSNVPLKINFECGEISDGQYMFYQSNIPRIDMNSVNLNNLSSATSFFAQCKATEILLKGVEMKNVSDMATMFEGCQVTSLDLSTLRPTKLYDLTGIFRQTSLDSLSFVGWDTSGVRYFTGAFQQCRIVGDAEDALDLSNINVSGALTLSAMFMNTETHNGVLDVSHFDAPKVNSLLYMFKGAQVKNLKILGMKTGPYLYNIEEMFDMFINYGEDKFLDLSSLDLTQVVDCSRVFRNIYGINEINFGNKFMSKASNTFSNMFTGCTIGEKNILLHIHPKFPYAHTYPTNPPTSLDSLGITIKYVEDMSISSRKHINYHSESGAKLFKNVILDYSNLSFNTVLLEDIFPAIVLQEALAVQLNIPATGEFDKSLLDAISRVEWDLSGKECTTLDGFNNFKNITRFRLENTSVVEEDSYLDLTNCKSLGYLGIPNVQVNNLKVATDSQFIRQVFFDEIKVQGVLDLDNVDTKNAELMNLVFNKVDIGELIISSWDFSNVTTLGQAFENSLFRTPLDLELICPKNKNCYYLFKGAKGINLKRFVMASDGVNFMGVLQGSEVDIRGVKMEIKGKPENTFGMFSDYKRVDINGFELDMSEATSQYRMFYGASSIFSEVIENLDTSNLTTVNGMFRGFRGDVLDLSKWDTNKVDNASDLFGDTPSLNMIKISPSFVGGDSNGEWFSSMLIDKVGRTIVYSQDDTITQKSQIKYHNSEGIPMYTLSTLVYDNLHSLPKTRVFMALDGADYPNVLSDSEYDMLKINGLEVSDRTMSKIKGGDFLLPSEGRYDFELYSEGVLVGNEHLVCLYSSNMAYNLEKIGKEDLMKLAETLE
ncbi:MAG: BspA family leucine-rich repeat surface protein [Cetobacterium sp.]